MLGLAGRPARRCPASALGVALGIATWWRCSACRVPAGPSWWREIDALGTNLLTVTPDQSLGGQAATLPPTAPAMAARIGPVDRRRGHRRRDGPACTGTTASPPANTSAITVYAADAGLLRTLQGNLARGTYLNAATARYPAVVLGADAAGALGIDRADGGSRYGWATGGSRVIGILRRLPLAPELDRTALIGYPVARGCCTPPRRRSQIYVRTNPASVAAVAAVLSATADPAAPQNVIGGRPDLPRSPPGPTPLSRCRNCPARWARWHCWSAASASPTSWSSRI